MEALQLENAELRNDLEAAGREVERLWGGVRVGAIRRLSVLMIARAAARAAERAEANELDAAVAAPRGATGRGRGEDAALGRSPSGCLNSTPRPFQC